MLKPKELKNFIARDHEDRVWLQRVCMMPPNTTLPGHPCVGKNRVLEFDGFFDLQSLIEWINETGLKPQTIKFEDIWRQSHFDGESEFALKTDRFKNADTQFPGILAQLPNPSNKPYRMLDGRHRLWKMQSQGLLQSAYYVIPDHEVFNHFWIPVPKQSLLSSLA